MIIVDEIQRLLSDSGKLENSAANWLTRLLNERVSPILLVGEPQGAAVFDRDYLSRRTLGEVTIRPFDWHHEVDRAQFQSLLFGFSSSLNMPVSADLHELGTALRIHSYSNGLVGFVVLLLEKARWRARRQGLPKLSYEILAKTVDELRIGEKKSLPNPFRIENPIPGGAPASGAVKGKLTGARGRSK